MFSSFGSRLVQGGRRSVVCNRVARVNARQNVCLKAYSTRKEMEEDLHVLKEEYNKSVKPLPVRQQLSEESESFVTDYKNLYNHFADPNTPTQTEFPSEFYDKSPRQQQAFAAFLEAYRATYGPLLEKHGSNLVPGLERVAAVMAHNHRGAGARQPVKVCVTGAAGHLGYALVFRIASGAVFGHNTPVILSLLEVPQALDRLQGVVMELRDCAFPVVRDIVATDSPDKAFSEVDYALLVGARPRSKDMERADLLTANAEIFSVQGKALNTYAKGKDTRVLVVGNPANTNALIASHFAPHIPKANFSAMTRLDHNRGLAQLAAKLNCKVSDIDRFIIWGNHSATQYPDITHAKLNDKWLADLIQDKAWLEKDFYPTVQKRGAAIIQARGLSSAASAASAAADAVADWHFGTNGKWTSAAVASSGEYGITEGLFYSYPVVYNSSRDWDIVRDLPITEASANYMEATHQELLKERDDIAKLLK